MSRLILLSFDEDAVTMQCPVCGDKRSEETPKFTPHVMFDFYRHHVIGHLSGKH